jgi:glycogen operon protein
MGSEDWQKPFVRSLAFLLGGDAIPSPDERGQRIIGDALLVLLNAHHEAVSFAVPPPTEGKRWVIQLYTASDELGPDAPVPPGRFELVGRSMAVFRQVSADS